MSGGSGAIVVYEEGASFDNFNRTEATDWGTSDPYGSAWVISGSIGKPYTATVDGSAGRMLIPSNWPGAAADKTCTIAGVAEVYGDFTALIKMRFVSAAPTTGAIPYMEFRFGNASATLEYGTPGTAQQSLALSMLGVAGSTEVTVAWPASWFWLRWERNWKGVHYIRMWADGDAEPAVWTVTRSSTGAETRSTNVLIFFIMASADIDNWIVEIDSLSIGDELAPVVISGR